MRIDFWETTLSCDPPGGELLVRAALDRLYLVYRGELGGVVSIEIPRVYQVQLRLALDEAWRKGAE